MPFLLPLLLSIIAISVNAQKIEKQDFVTCFEQILSDETIMPFLDAQIRDYGAIILPKTFQIPRRGQLGREILDQFENEDFFDLPYRVDVMTDGMINEQISNRQRLMRWTFVGRGQEIHIMVNYLDEQELDRVLTTYIFKKDRYDWNIINQQTKRI